MALFILDPTPFVFRISSHNPRHLTLNVKMAILPTSYGPIIMFLFWIPARDSQDPLFMHEHFLDPHAEGHCKPYFRLASQTHWHVVLLGPGQRVLNMYEMENVYGLNKMLDIGLKVCEGNYCKNFEKARNEIQERFSTKELFAMNEGTVTI